MQLKVLVAPDKFKGSLCAAAAAEAITRGWKSARPNDAVDLLPITDGGDGFGKVVGQLLNAKIQKTRTVDAAHRPLVGQWWWEPQSRTAVIESANIIGLALLPRGHFHPFALDTFGLGAVLEAAAAAGAKSCLIGIGGSATNDGGFGLARALGWTFLNAAAQPLEKWTDLHALHHIQAPKRRRWFNRIWVAVDVQNRLLGKRGATRVYGPQKGVREKDFAPAERCLSRFARVFAEQFGGDFERVPGSGAAGGLGYGLMACLGASPKPGFDIFARMAKLDRRLRSADLVITGEGSVDSSTLMGKGVGELARRCRRLRIPCLALAGRADFSQGTRSGFVQVHAITPRLASPEDSFRKPAYWLERLSREAALQWTNSPES